MRLYVGIQRQMLAVMTSIMMLAMWNMTSYGSEQTIRSITVTVTSDVEAGAGGGSVSAIANDARYSVTSCDFTAFNGSWSAGETPRVTIELQAEEGYRFNSIRSGDVSLKGASYVSNRRGEDGQSLILTVKLKPVNGMLGTPEEAGWINSSPGRAKWSKVDYAPAYEVKLYYDDRVIYHVKKTTAANYNFFPYMTKKGDYYYTVRAIPRSREEAKYLKAGSWQESGFQEITLKDAAAAGNTKPNQNQNQNPGKGAAGWVQDQNGWWYRNADQTYPQNTWQLIDGKWYLFDMSGYMLTGWQTWNQNRFYLTSNGDLVTGWLQYDRSWYYIDVNKGSYTDGWLKLGDDWYFFNYDGKMITGWLKWKEQWYYLDPASGKMVTNQMVGSYYVNGDGVWVNNG